MKKSLNYPADAPDKKAIKPNVFKGTITSAVENLEQLFCYTFKRNNEHKNK